jgi:4-amino-4-deoxy-L-arabinose transferase-like glycosyltransferase
LFVIWLCFILRGVFYAAALPLWEGYDEYSHFAYVQYLSLHGSSPIPGISRISREVSTSLGTTPLPWTLKDLVPGAIRYDDFWSLPPNLRETRVAPLTKGGDAASRQEDPLGEKLYESQQPPLYYWLMAPVLGSAENWSLPSRVLLLRLVSLLLASLALPLGFAIARRVLGSAPLAICTVAAVVSMPEAMIDLARIGNESLALLLYTLLIYACVRMLDEGPDRRNSVLIGVALGCGLLTKAYFLTAIPAVCAGFALTLRRAGSASRRTAALLAVSLSIAILSSFWWYRFIYHTTGDFTGQIQSVAVVAIPWQERLRVAWRLDWLAALDTAMFSHIWFGGWSFLQVRSWIYHFFYAVGMASAIGLMVLSLRRRSVAPVVNRRSLLLLGLLEACFAASLAYQVTLAQIVYGKPMTNGWYLYCLVFAEIVLVCAGLMALLPHRRRIFAPIGLVGCFVALDLYGMNFVLLPYYFGLIVHSPAGRLQTFHVSQLWRTGLSEISSRLLLNRPYLSAPAEFAGLWVLYLAATMTCLAVAFMQSRQPPPATPRDSAVAEASRHR